MSRMTFDIPQPEPAAKNPEPAIVNAPYKHSVVDSKKTPIETIASHIGGSNLLTNYYSQLFTKSEELKAFDPTQLNVYQQYHKINNLIIKLQGPLSGGDQSSENGRYTLTGRAIIPPNPTLIPNYGDALIIDIGEGQAGQFTVTRVNKLSHNLASAWEIDFAMDRLADQHIVGLLDGKVSRESYYQKDYLITGQNPFLAAEDYQAGQTLEDWFRIIARQIAMKNFSVQTNTLTIPLQQQITYDPFVTKAMSRIVATNEVPEIHKLTLYNVDDYRVPKHLDVYSAVLAQDYTLMYSVFTEFRSLQADAMFTNAYQNPIRTSGVRRVVVPFDTRLDNDNYTGLLELINKYGSHSLPGIIAGESPGIGGSTSSSQYGIDECGCSNENNPHYQKTKPVNPDNTSNPGMAIPKVTNASYSLTRAFYDKDLTGCTRFERDVWLVIERKPIDRENIYQYCNSFHLWGRLEQFYYGPFLLMMIKHALRGL